MKKFPKILMMPNWKGWYVEAHAEYLIRHLSDEFYFDMEMPIVPRDGISNPFMKNPDDYDLLWPMWPGAWLVDDPDKYAHKIATVFYCPNEGRFRDVAVVGASTPIVEKSLLDQNFKFHSLRFGIDTNLFAPNPIRNCCDKLHVGYVGNHANVRHMVKDVISSLTEVEGIHLMLFPSSWKNGGGTLTDWDGEKMMPYVVTGDKLWTGMPNIYNRMDVLLRMDEDPAYSFPTLEAAACGVPVIATNSGIDHLITGAGGGILLDGDRNYYMNNHAEMAKRLQEAVIWMRDHKGQREKMGIDGRTEIMHHWTWDKFLPAWREFFRDGIAKGAA